MSDTAVDSKARNDSDGDVGTGGTDTFALAVPVAETRFFSEDVDISQLIEGVSAGLGREQKHMLLLLSPTRELYLRTERYLTAGHVDGVIIASLHKDDPLPGALKDAGVPVVTSGRSLEPLGIPFVDVDHKSAVHNAAFYLFGQGRKYVAHVAGPSDMVAGVERRAGYEAAMEERGEEPVVEQGDFTRESGYVAMHHILTRMPRVDAVLCASDLMAAGAMDAIRAAGHRVPQDVAVVGFDDIALAQHMSPPLTTIRQPIREFGAALAHQVVRMAAGEPGNDSVMLPTEFVVRESA